MRKTLIAYPSMIDDGNTKDLHFKQGSSFKPCLEEVVPKLLLVVPGEDDGAVAVHEIPAQPQRIMIVAGPARFLHMVRLYAVCSAQVNGVSDSLEPSRVRLPR